MKRYYQQFGFTLVELLIVIIIMGVLAALAVPSLNKQIAQSKLNKAVYLTKNSLEQSRADALVYQTPIVTFVGRNTTGANQSISSNRKQNGANIQNASPVFFDENINIKKENGMTDYIVFTQTKQAYSNTKNTTDAADYSSSAMPEFSSTAPQGFGFCYKGLVGTEYIVTVDSLSNIRVVEKAGGCS